MDFFMKSGGEGHFHISEGKNNHELVILLKGIVKFHIFTLSLVSCSNIVRMFSFLIQNQNCC